MHTPYSHSFYVGQQDGSANSAAIIVPLIMQMFPHTRSVVDVGCGVGGWLKSFKEHGVGTVLGIDGEYAPRDMLMIEPSEFIAADLNLFTGAPRRFDLGISLEVAEHLPPSSAASFIEGLVRSAPVIAFSAAIPGQGGTNHINEQWQGYWASLFASHGYSAVDCIRPSIYGNTIVEPWYRQNIIVYCVPEHCPDGYSAITSRYILDRIDPEFLERKGMRSAREALQTMRACLPVVGKAVMKRISATSRNGGFTTWQQ